MHPNSVPRAEWCACRRNTDAHPSMDMWITCCSISLDGRLASSTTSQTSDELVIELARFKFVTYFPIRSWDSTTCSSLNADAFGNVQICGLRVYVFHDASCMSASASSCPPIRDRLSIACEEMGLFTVGETVGNSLLL